MSVPKDGPSICVDIHDVERFLPPVSFSYFIRFLLQQAPALAD